MKDGSSNGKLAHLQGCSDDRLNVANVDLASDIQDAAGAAFDHIPLLVARGWLHGKELVWLGVHDGAEKVKGKMPTGDKAGRVNAGEEAGQVLIVDERGCVVVEVALF